MTSLPTDTETINILLKEVSLLKGEVHLLKGSPDTMNKPTNSPTSMTLPNLAGVASKDLVETIGSGRFTAAYLNWSRTMNLLRTHAPGWLVDYVPAEDGSLLHKAPVGAYLLIRFQNMETGTVTPALPQAVMDHRNKSIPYDKIEARDVTDTQRRGMCMAAAMHFGLAYELWAKMPMESGYDQGGSEAAPKAPTAAPKAAVPGDQPSPAKVAAEDTEATFREAALAKGVDTRAIDALVTIVGEKLGGDFSKGLATLNAKSAEELNAKYAPAQAADSGGEW